MKTLHLITSTLVLFGSIACSGDGGNASPTEPRPRICSQDCDSGQGACSGHGGVNCAAGPDSDGSVICNDGWRDSSVRYRCS